VGQNKQENKKRQNGEEKRGKPKNTELPGNISEVKKLGWGGFPQKKIRSEVSPAKAS